MAGKLAYVRHLQHLDSVREYSTRYSSIAMAGFFAQQYFFQQCVMDAHNQRRCFELIEHYRIADEIRLLIFQNLFSGLQIDLQTSKHTHIDGEIRNLLGVHCSDRDIRVAKEAWWSTITYIHSIERVNVRAAAILLLEPDISGNAPMRALNIIRSEPQSSLDNALGSVNPSIKNLELTVLVPFSPNENIAFRWRGLYDLIGEYYRCALPWPIGLASLDSLKIIIQADCKQDPNGGWADRGPSQPRVKRMEHAWDQGIHYMMEALVCRLRQHKITNGLKKAGLQICFPDEREDMFWLDGVGMMDCEIREYIMGETGGETGAVWL